METEAKCPVCGRPLAPNATRGLCPRCLFELGQAHDVSLDTPTAVAAPASATNGAFMGHGAPGADDQSAFRNPQSAMGLGCFGDYELLEEIARGGMGVVYRARQISLDRIVAVKMILFGSMASAEQVRRFRIEASAAGSLQHPNIVTVHEVGLHEGQHFLVMDYVDGPNLSRLVQDQPLPARKAATYLKAIAEAAQFAHDRGILHRDLKPSNVLMGSDDRPRVTDFGLAKRFDMESSLTLSGHVLGSPNYMPPEQAGGGRNKVGRTSDVYSLGAILYHLLTARPPFRAETISETLQQVQTSEPLSPRLLNPSVPRDLETICLKCLEKEPEKRFANAQELADELARFLNDEPIQARPVTRAERAWRWCRRKPALASAIGLAAVLLLVVSIGSPLVALRIDRARQETALNLYAADIKNANTALEEHDLPGARKLLEEIDRSPDQRKLRGWEWRFLMNQCRGDEVAVLNGHNSWLEGVAFSPDDKVLASISGDGVVKLWDWALRKEILSWQAHRPVLKHQQMTPAHGLMFLPRTSILATTGADEFVHLWNLGSTNPLVTFPNPGGPSGLLACTPDGRLLATRGGTNQVLLWDVSKLLQPIHQPKPVASLNTRMRYIWEVLFLSDGKSLLVSTSEGIQWWEISNVENPTKRNTTVPGHLNMALSHDGRDLVTWANNSFMMWDLESSAVEREVQKKGRPVAESRGVTQSLFKFSPDQRSLVSSPNETIVFWDLKGERLPVTLKGHNDVIRGVAFTSDGRVLASASLEKTVRVWDVANIWRDDFNKQPVLRHEGRVVAVAFSPNSKYLASISWDGLEKVQGLGLPPATLKLWDAATRTEIGTVPIRQRVSFKRIVFSPGGQILVFEDEGKLHLYTVPSLQPVTNWPGLRPAYSKDGSAMVYALGKRVVRRNLATGQEVPIGEQSDDVLALALSPDGGTVVTSGKDSGGTMTFWDALGQGPPVIVENHLGLVEEVAFSPDGQTLASASWDGKLGLWNVKERRTLDLLRGHKGRVTKVAFSPDGRTVATVSSDQTVRLWNLKTRREVAVLRGHPGEPLAFSPDGQWLASGSIHFWRAPSFEEIAVAQKAKEERK
ncbi:MAG: serine/threonine-protein kinase [Verrucomicrobiota bacterium]